MSVRVLIDCDGVLANFVKATLDYVKTVATPDEYVPTEEEWTSWDFTGVFSSRLCRLIHQYWHKETSVANMDPYTPAFIGMDTLYNIPYVRVHIVTTAMDTPYWLAERKDWLWNHFDVNPWDITFTAQKEYVRGDVFIDDKLENVQAWVKANPGGVGVVWDRPWNQGEVDSWNIIRTNDWDRVVRLVRTMEGKHV